MIRLIQANLARFKGPRFDATGLIDAAQRLKSYRAQYPASAERLGVDALLIRIDESLAMRDMVAADWHRLRKQPLSAIYLYQRVVQDYPQTAAAQDALHALEKLGAQPLAMHVPSNNDQAADVLLNRVKPARPTPGEAEAQSAKPRVTPTDVGESQPYEVAPEPVETEPEGEPAPQPDIAPQAAPTPEPAPEPATQDDTASQPQPEKP